MTVAFLFEDFLLISGAGYCYYYLSITNFLMAVIVQVRYYRVTSIEEEPASSLGYQEINLALGRVL